MFQAFIRFILRYFITFLVVVGVLAAGKLLIDEAEAYRSARSNLDALEDTARRIETDTSALAAQASASVDRLRNASITSLDARIGALSQEIQMLSAQPPHDLIFSLTKAGGPMGALLDRTKRAAHIELLAQERDYLSQLRASASAGLERKTAAEKLEQRRQEHARVYQALQQNLQAQEQSRLAAPFRVWVPGLPEHAGFKALRDHEPALRQANSLAHQAYLDQNAAIGRMQVLKELAPFRIDRERLDLAVRPLRDALDSQSNTIAGNWMSRLSAPIMGVIPTAALLVLTMFMVPVLIKLVFYFVLAPLAARQPVIRIEDTDGHIPDSAPAANSYGSEGREGREESEGNETEAPLAGKSRVSGVSQSVTIGSDDELLIHPEYIQSSSIRGHKDTRWLLDWSCPFTSIAAGLVALTRIRTDRHESVVVSATEDPLSEIAILVLPEGAAMVFQPRGLVGVIHRREHPFIIERRWRLGSLHAWLSLQLRYLVFRGPVTLIVKGCRGIRVEAAGEGRSISQSATLGFSTTVAYATIRSETFFPYLTGRQALFNDRFEGNSGVYVYEETPRTGKKGGVLGRGLEGFTDSVLKIFGI